MTELEILIPTKDRPSALVGTLSSLAYQSSQSFALCISDQSESLAIYDASVQTLLRLHQEKHETTYVTNLPRKGMAEQRQFLLSLSTAPYVLFLDDDILLEPWVIEKLVSIIKDQGCGMVGMAVIGLSYRGDYRPQEQQIEFWEGVVEPELVVPGEEKWSRYQLHNAANLYHLQQQHPEWHNRCYKVAWIGGCVLYDRNKLLQCGGFAFWPQLPPDHCGEDVWAQLQVIKRFGGCGVFPSGAYHQEHFTTLPHRDYNIPEKFKNI